VILGIDTSTPRASVALTDGGVTVAERESEARAHSEQIIDLIAAVLDAGQIAFADLEGIAVGAGPGSFTGLRIGMATAKGLCYAAGKPLWAVSSLAALALGAVRQHGRDALLVPVLDARRKEVFVGYYRAGDRGVEAVAPEAVMAPAAVAAAVAAIGGGAVLFGDGVDLYREKLAGAGELGAGPSRPSAADVARLALHRDPADLAAVAPVYIRKSEAEIRYPDGNPGGSFKPG
jgi:tRNA threonylcarbamoyladenosine biosynthesis protein TsaB